MKQLPTYKPQVVCPSCGKQSNIDYCSFNVEYVWWCENKSCGRQYRFKINPDWSVESEPTGNIISQDKVTLKITPKSSNIYFIVYGKVFNDVSNHQYFYEEHTCPVNLLRDGIKVLYRGDNDPHGIFQFVRSEPIIYNRETNNGN